MRKISKLNLNLIYASPIKVGKTSFIVEFPLETLKHLNIQDKKVFWRAHQKAITLTKNQNELEIPTLISVDEFENQ